MQIEYILISKVNRTTNTFMTQVKNLQKWKCYFQKNDRENYEMSFFPDKFIKWKTGV